MPVYIFGGGGVHVLTVRGVFTVVQLDYKAMGALDPTVAGSKDEFKPDRWLTAEGATNYDKFQHPLVSPVTPSACTGLAAFQSGKRLSTSGGLGPHLKYNELRVFTMALSMCTCSTHSMSFHTILNNHCWAIVMA